MKIEKSAIPGVFWLENGKKHPATINMVPGVVYDTAINTVPDAVINAFPDVVCADYTYIFILFRRLRRNLNTLVYLYAG